MLIFLIGAALLLAVDLIAKAVITGDGFTLIPGVLSIIKPIRNPGAAFGMPIPLWLLVGVTIIIIAVGSFLYWKLKSCRKSKFYNIGCAFVLGGALGNLVDRILFGSVRDFLQFDFFNFPIFNFADVFLNIGMVMLVIYFIFMYKGKKRADTKS